jgi:hypothetical protein
MIKVTNESGDATQSLKNCQDAVNFGLSSVNYTYSLAAELTTSFPEQTDNLL